MPWPEREAKEAVASLERACTLSGRRDPVPLESLGYVKGVMGAKAEARKLLDELQELSKQGYVSPVSMATVCAGLGDKDLPLARQSLRRAQRPTQPASWRFPVGQPAWRSEIHGAPQQDGAREIAPFGLK